MTDLKQAGIIFAFGCTAGIVSFNTSMSHWLAPIQIEA
jgi:hypothetical protein